MSLADLNVHCLDNYRQQNSRRISLDVLSPDLNHAKGERSDHREEFGIPFGTDAVQAEFIVEPKEHEVLRAVFPFGDD